MFRELDSPSKAMKNMFDQRMSAKKNLQIFVVTGIGSEDKKTGLISEYKCSVKSMVTKVQYDNVPMMGIGLGHFKGIIKYPEVGDFVLCVFLDETPNPIILGTLFDSTSQGKVSVPGIKRKELLMVNKLFGSAIYMKDDGTIILKGADPETGNFKDGLNLTRAQIKISPGKGIIPGSITESTDGAKTDLVGGLWTVVVGGAATITFVGQLSFFQPSTGAGIFISPTGAVTIKGTSVDFVKV